MLAAGGLRIVCGLHVQRFIYLSGRDTKFDVRLLKAAFCLFVKEALLINHVLYCTVLYCIVLYCTVLYCTVHGQCAV